MPPASTTAADRGESEVPKQKEGDGKEGSNEASKNPQAKSDENEADDMDEDLAEEFNGSQKRGAEGENNDGESFAKLPKTARKNAETAKQQNGDGTEPRAIQNS